MLSVLEEGGGVSQRELASRIGVALGFANKLLKRAVNKGLLKVSEAPARRYAYYLTPKGFAEKSRLVGEYLTSSLEFFRLARQESEKLLVQIKSDNRMKVALFGMGEFAEITIMASRVAEVDISYVIDVDTDKTSFLDIEVLDSLDQAKELGVDAVIVCTTDDPQESYFTLLDFFSDAEIYTTGLVHITRKPREDFFTSAL